MKKYKSLLAFLFICFSSVFMAQNKEMEAEAEKNFESKNFEKAYELYDKLYSQSPKTYEYKSKLAFSALNYPDKKARAIELFEEIKLTNKLDDIDYYLGKAYHVNYRFDEAIKSYQAYLTKKGAKFKITDKEFVKDAQRGIINCNNGNEILANKVIIDIENIGHPINTNEIEGVPLISADGSMIIYTYVGEKSTGGLLNDQLVKDKINGTYREDIFMSTRINDTTWALPFGVSSLNTKGNDAAVAISPDGQTLFSFDSDETNTGDLYYSKLSGSQWSRPLKLNKNINSEYWEGSCSISSDGRFLYFSSERPGGYGGIDLYVSEKINGDWGVAKNLGPMVNTELNEDCPFIHTDGITLFFSSEAHKSIGGYDIMFSVRKDNNWISPISMGIPLNTTENDKFYVINAKSDMGYFSSERVGGKGKQDIYIVTPGISGKKPILALLKGKVYADNKPTEAKIELIKEATQEAIEPYYANSITGNYLMAVTPGNRYKVKVTVAGMEPINDEINIENLPFFVEVNKDFNVYSPGFVDKKVEVSIKQILDSLLANITNAEDFNNDVQINKIVDATIKSDSSQNNSTASTTTATNNDTVKIENLADNTTISKTNNSSLPTNTLSGNPCNGSPTPDFTALKGKSLNDPAVYKQLLNMAGTMCAEGLIFKVQIAAYKHPENYKYDFLKEFGAPEIVNYPDGITRFTQFSFPTMKEAEVARQKIIAKGQKDAWLTGFIDGKRFTLEELILVNFAGKAVN